jgi:hypothetical protein
MLLMLLRTRQAGSLGIAIRRVLPPAGMVCVCVCGGACVCVCVDEGEIMHVSVPSAKNHIKRSAAPYEHDMCH